MATKKDLVEAHAFSRRRLVTAFLSGAPGGREVEPVRPGRTVVAGLALAVLLVAGAAVAGVFTSRPPVDWTEPGLVVSKEKGAAYVITEQAADPVLRPVINITSAQLILGAEMEPEIVPQAEIDAQTVGEDIGILGAPAHVPSPDVLLDGGWAACTGHRLGLLAGISERPWAVADPGAAVVVRSEGELFVVTAGREEPDGLQRAYALRVPSRGVPDNLLTALGLPNSAEATEVPRQWLGLFPAGEDLSRDSFALTGLGDRADGAGEPGSGLPGGARVGDWYDVGGRPFVLTEAGPAPADEFALAVYLSSPGSDGFRPRQLDLPAAPQLEQARSLSESTVWPDALPEGRDEDVCALLAPAAGERPGVLLGFDPVETASPRAAALGPGERDLVVDAGRGVLVLSAGWEDREDGQPFLVDSTNRHYELVGVEAPARLGYADVDAAVVPDSWLELFEPGVPLSVNAALCPPSAGSPTGSECR